MKLRGHGLQWFDQSGRQMGIFTDWRMEAAGA